MENGVITGVIKKTPSLAVAFFLGPKLEEGQKVYQYNNPTDDCILPGHVAISLSEKRETFFGIPMNLVNWQ
ncbi:MAG: hypothetical protein ACOYL8_03895 [Patescibacteria group bacterium]